MSNTDGGAAEHGARAPQELAEKVPEGFEEWPESAQWSWLSNGPLTQREMLLFTAGKLGLNVSIGGTGPLTNDDLGRFLGAVLNEGGG